MFDNITNLKLMKGSHNECMVSAICSSEGEVMEYRTMITAEGRVEDWMSNVLSEMRRTNRLITKEAVYYYCENDITRSATSAVRFCFLLMAEALASHGQR